MVFDVNVTNALTVALTNLNMTLAAGGGERKAVNYLSFSRRDDENINDFITKLEKVFIVNRVADSRKHLVVISCLKGTTANFYDELVRITN